MTDTLYQKPIAEWTVGDRVEGFFLLKEATQKVTGAGKDYLTGAISDKSGSMEFKIWDYKGPIGSKQIGSAVKIRGEVSEYRGSLQITIERIRCVTKEDGFQPSLLAPSAPIDRETAKKELEDLLNSIEDGDYRSLALKIYNDHTEAFLSVPAAKNVHHAFISGLLMHTLSMMKIADAVVGHYPVADRSLLLTGTFLHDVAKEREFNLSDLGLVSDYSAEGELLGHAAMGAEEVEKAASSLGLSGEKPMLVKHMLLSHHGLPEFGAAKLPAIPEAELLSLIDLIDSRMELYAETFSQMEKGTFSNRIFYLDNRRLYKHF